MKNPFVYGEAVTGENFSNRKEELCEITRDLEDCERIFLISPRRYGKTSLIMNVVENLRTKGLYTVYIDLYKATSIQKLLEIYASEIVRAVESKLERMFNFLKKTLPGLRPKITIQPDGSATIGIEHFPTESDTLRFLDEIYELPQKLAEKKNKNFIIVFDEFQEIRNFNGESIEKAMRASFQHHSKVGYLFAGSKRHILYDMVANPSKAFYKMGRVITLNKIPRLEFSEFLRQAFERTGFTLEEGAVHKILDLVNDYPYNAQFLCHKLWDVYFDVKKIRTNDIEPTLNLILTENTPFYLSIWDGLSMHQRRLLHSIANLGGDHIFSQEFIASGDLGSSSTIQTSLRLLIKKQVLDKENDIYFVTDVFFKEWIRRKI